MKKIIEKMKGIYNANPQKVTLFGSVALVMFVIIIIISIVVKIVGLKISYEELEDKLEQATYTYLSENPTYLPNKSNPTVVVSANTLIENKYIKNLKKYVKDASCTANVIVDYENNDYKYQAYLTCNNFKTEKFIDTIKKNNELSLVGEGLYEMNNEFIFRGQNPNNYVEFANELWRIVKIDKNNNIEMIITELEEDSDDEYFYGVWDDRYNTEEDYQYGINTFGLSRALIQIKDVYNAKYHQYQEYLTPYNLCAGKRAEESTGKDGNLECSEFVSNQYIGLLPLYDYMNASLDGLCQKSMSKECQNYNYLVNEDFSWWTMTGNTASTYQVYSISYNGEIESEYASYDEALRYVLALNSDVFFASGDGTRDNPYTIR